ncbi:LOW QUALITY PROTEIN: hypothetical protein M514_04973 [Trichuris suis]|uniref:DUF4371 domain-containing protein n=1 Tax=Trichuris suis TaxID=68888 RepID=A0A085NNY3_9BILA|nr:LOW QUALITY PROTEIN: hypothetical protein M514_04973 [Trichuris suis]
MTFLRTTPFALQLGESTLPSNEALLLTYVQLIMDERLLQQLLFARELVTDTKRESIFLVNFFKEKNIPLMNITTVTTDGVPSMVGNHRRFIAQLKEFVPSVLEVYLRDSSAAFGRKTPQLSFELLTAVRHCSGEQSQV